MKRIEERKSSEKDDRSIYDFSEFQKRLNKIFQNRWLKELFESKGTVVRYLDASISPESTRKQAAKIYIDFLSAGNWDLILNVLIQTFKLHDVIIPPLTLHLLNKI